MEVINKNSHQIDKQKTLNYIQRLLDLDFSVSKIAEYLNMSRGWVYVTIKANRLKRKGS